MTGKYQDWLASNVIAGEQTVTYRWLSRVFKVHANTAKQMLYDFHQTQNTRKPSSIYATYLISGIRKPGAPANGINGSHKDGEDSAMADVSFSGAMSSSMPEHETQIAETIPVTTITLVNEGKLSDVKAEYESISSIHIYSLSPGPIADLQVLSDCNRRFAIEYANEDHLETWKTYGTIHNPKAQRRATRVPPPAPASAANVTAGMKAKPAAAAINTARPETTASSKTDEPKAAPQAAGSSTITAAKKPPTAKRESSNLMASFGKTAASNAKLKLNTPADGAENEDAMEEDQPSAPEETAEQRARAEAARQDKAAKEAKLRAMMEGDDEEHKEDDDADEEMKDAWSESEPEPEPEPEPQAAPEAPAASAPAEQGVTTNNGRRRGRRRVMKKKTTKDAEGYLVTKEEAAWESFSEDEGPAPAKVEPATKKAKTESPASSGDVAKKSTGTAAKKGQGSIMSFFKK